MNAPTDLMAHVQGYVTAGLTLVPVHFASKRPMGDQWNSPENLVTTAEKATATWGSQRLNLGVHLGQSKLCSFDPDELAVVASLLEQTSGADAVGILNSGWRVVGSPSSGRAIFRVPENTSLPYLKYSVPASVAKELGITLSAKALAALASGDTPAEVTVLELRAGERMDMLPPSIHPDTKRPYQSNFTPLRHTDIPEPPPELIDLWQNFEAYRTAFNSLLGIANKEQKPQKPPQANSTGQRGALEVAAAYSAHRGHDFDSLLSRHGYESKGRKWLAPGSTTGLAGVILLKDEQHILSFHGSDKLGGGKTPHDYFDCWRILEHDGDWSKALRQAKDEMGWTEAEVLADFGELLDSTPPPEQVTRPFFISVGEILANREPPQYLIHRHITEASLNLLFGGSTVGKSFMAIDWSLSIATGQAWQGHAVKQGAVAYLAGEGHAGFRRRCAAWAKHNWVDIEGAPLYFNQQTVTLIDESSCLKAHKAVAAIEQQHGPVALIVLDTLNRTGGGNEDDNSDTSTILRHLEKYFVRPFKCACLIVHHTGHGEETKHRSRGASALPAGMDTIFLMAEVGGVRRLIPTKQKEAELGEPKAFKLVDVVLDDWPPDEDTGELQKSAVLVSTDEQPEQNAKRMKLSARLTDALDCLSQAVVDFQTVEPPQEIRDKLGLLTPSCVVPEHIWREAFYTTPTLEADADPKTRQKAFRRSVDDLLKRKLVDGSHGFYWRI